MFKTNEITDQQAEEELYNELFFTNPPKKSFSIFSFILGFINIFYWTIMLLILIPAFILFLILPFFSPL